MLSRSLVALVLLTMAQFSFASTVREFHYKDGQCINQNGVEGYNGFSTVFVSQPVEKAVAIKFGFSGDTSEKYSYYSVFDGECVDFTSSQGSISEIFFKARVSRVWIQYMNLKGAKLSSNSGMIGDFDCPRAAFEGFKDDGSYMNVYSNIAATVDEHTKLSGRIRQISIGKGVWEDAVVFANDIFYSTNSSP